MREGEALAVPPFLTKLFDILSNDSLRDFITWGDGGKVIHVADPLGFQTTVLPNYWRHNNMRSFIRQLNMYGFQRRCEDVAQGKLDFIHPNFRQVRGTAAPNPTRSARVHLLRQPHNMSPRAHGAEGGWHARPAASPHRSLFPTAQGQRELLPLIQRKGQSRKRQLDAGPGVVADSPPVAYSTDGAHPAGAPPPHVRAASALAPRSLAPVRRASPVHPSARPLAHLPPEPSTLFCPWRLFVHRRALRTLRLLRSCSTSAGWSSS